MKILDIVRGIAAFRTKRGRQVCSSSAPPKEAGAAVSG
jgi:hypothetical protein